MRASSAAKKNKELQEQNKKLAAENKQLKNKKGSVADAGSDKPTNDNKDIKELERRIKEAKDFAAKFPEINCQNAVEKLEAQLLEARPPKTVQTSELQKELEDIEKAIEDRKE